MADLFKVMLAAHPKPEEIDAIISGLDYPLLGGIKYDGVRCTVQNGVLYQRSLKPVLNRAMQAMWGKKQFNGLDAEIIVGDPVAPDCFHVSSGVVRNANKPAAGAVLCVFDKYGKGPYNERLAEAREVVLRAAMGNHMLWIDHPALKSAKALATFERNATEHRHEGVILRDPLGLYKEGRSTLKEGGLIALKRTVDAEAIILDTYEQELNTNTQTVNELGKLKRSSHKAGKVGKGTLGGFTVALIPMCRCHGLIVPGKAREFKSCAHTFNIGTGVGLTEAVRKLLWVTRDALPGKLIKLRYQPVGTMEKPRQPIFLGFRDKEDM